MFLCYEEGFHNYLFHSLGTIQGQCHHKNGKFWSSFALYQHLTLFSLPLPLMSLPKYTRIFDSISVQSLSEQKDLYVNFIVQSLKNQFLDFDSCLFRLVKEMWHHPRHLSQIALLSNLEMCLWQTRHVHPLFSFLWKFSSAACHPVWLNYFSMRRTSIFSSQTVSGIALEPNRLSIDIGLEPSIAATTLTLLVKHSSMTLSFSIGLSFEKGLSLLITPLCFFYLRQSDNCGFCSPRSSFLFHFWRYFNFS